MLVSCLLLFIFYVFVLHRFPVFFLHLWQILQKIFAETSGNGTKSRNDGLEINGIP